MASHMLGWLPVKSIKSMNIQKYFQKCHPDHLVSTRLNPSGDFTTRFQSSPMKARIGCSLRALLFGTLAWAS